MAEIAPPAIAIWKPFPNKSTTPLTKDIICVHTMVGTLAGSWSYAAKAGNPYWHFGTGGDGQVWQCQDLRYRSAANLNGNHHVIPIENADMGPGFGPWSGRCGDVPPFTPIQQAKLTDLIEWLCRRYSIPPVLIPDSKPGRRGIGYHRQGIDPWRVSGGELWSKATGKCCPDDRRIRQLTTEIIPEVARRIRGGTRPPPPPPPPPEEDDMFIADCQGRPALLVGGGNVTPLDAAQRNALRKGGVRAVLVTTAEHDALTKLDTVEDTALYRVELRLIDLQNRLPSGT
jgi:hypothetical protein